MSLNEAELGKEYVIKDLKLDGDEDLKAFLFSLGCYSGEKITVVDKHKNLVVSRSWFSRSNRNIIFKFLPDLCGRA